MRIRDGKNSDPGSGMEKFGSGINIPDIRNTGLEEILVIHLKYFLLLFLPVLS
jgi:hypothetical protein